MEINATDSGGRVTRSLRKRLASVDSENSSRPGTPIVSKLSSITEISASPSRSTRLTRRNSTSGSGTPVKTPVKKTIGSSAIITENADMTTPSRRSTRKRSLSVNENEEAPHMGIKVPLFPALTEEGISTEINSTTTKRVTRSQSKSPQQQNTLNKSPCEIKNKDNDTLKRRKPGPKCKTQKNDDLDSSDVEISVVGKDDESNQTEITGINIEKVHEKNDAYVSHTASLVAKEKNTNESEITLKENHVENTDKSIELKGDDGNSIKGELEKQTGNDFTLKEIRSSVTIIAKKNNGKDSGSDESNGNQNENTTEINSTGSQSEFNEGSNVEQISSVSIEQIKKSKECMTPQTNKNCNNVEIISINTLDSYQDIDKENLSITDSKTSLKKVDFSLSPANDINVKHVYPKTPASTKTKINFIEIDPSHNDSYFRANKNVKIEEKDKEVLINTCKMTPKGSHNYIQKLQEVQSSTPINSEALAVNDSIEENKSVKNYDEEKCNDFISTYTKTEEDKTQMMWINPNVKGKMIEGCKLDTLVGQNKSIIELESRNPAISESDEMGTIISTDDDSNECRKKELENEEYEEFEEEFDHGDEDNRKKHDFIDDEAMEVEDYESGNSMDSEERKEMVENDIPIDGESIGSHTTDDNDECIEEEDNETDNSFIISDNNEVDSSESDGQNEFDDEGEEIKQLQHNNNKKRKTYKRLQLHSESSLSDDSADYGQSQGKTEEDEKIMVVESNIDDKTKQLNQEGIENVCKDSEENFISLDNEDEEKAIDENKAETNSLCKSIINKSVDNNLLECSKHSDSALRLQCSTDDESEEGNNVDKSLNTSRNEILLKLNRADQFNKSVRDLITEIVDTSLVEENQSNSSNDPKTEIFEENNNKSKNENFKEDDVFKDYRERESSSKEVSIIRQSNANKQLSTSFDNFNKAKVNKERKKWQRSFTISLTVKDGDLNTTVTDKKSEEISAPVPSSYPDIQDIKNLTNEDEKSLENLRHDLLPLSNPLFRTRRQSLALPTNPNMEIYSSNGCEENTKSKRMSLGILPNNDFKPSQSFIDSIELNKCDHKSLVAKRKRLSKSFCGASDTLDNSVTDIDMRHLHKRSRMSSENSLVESRQGSSENIDTVKMPTKISSTPYEKKSNISSKNNIQHILNRCDEILEAANHAKLEAKIKKSEVKLSKKKKHMVSSHKTNDDNDGDVLKKSSKTIKHKTKTAIAHAIKTAAKILNNKQLDDNIESKQLPSKVLENIEKLETKQKLNKKEIYNNQTKEYCYHHSTVTAAGNFVEMPQSPEKKGKKTTYIQLPTGKVSVEPVTPKKRLVAACNGTEFRESPVTPSATGFRVRDIPLADRNASLGTTPKGGKRKRYYDAPFKQNTLPKPQWTQSGPFLEEEIPTIHRSSCTDKAHRPVLRKFKESANEHEYLNTSNWNFKQKAMMRSDVKRSTNREVMLLRARRHAQGRY